MKLVFIFFFSLSPAFAHSQSTSTLVEEKMGNPLTPDQVHSDIDFLENYLQRGYIGSYYIKKEIMDNVHLALLELKKRSLAPIEPNIFCENLIGILQVIPDAHFDIQLPKICGHGNYIKKELVDVGNNVAPITEKWLHKIQKTSHGVSVDIIGLPSFHTAGNIKDSEWQKFIGTPSFLYKKPFFIIDLRGNHGGSLDVFFPWVEQMISTKESFKLTYFQLKTTEAIQVQINGNESALKHTNDPEYRKYLLKNIKDLEQEKHTLPASRDIQEKTEQTYGKLAKTYPGIIYILVNGETTSAAEHAVGWFSSAFKTVTIGAPTAGAVHFGGKGLITLPNSKIQIGLGTEYYPHKFGFIELVGIKPQISLKNNEDALKRALTEIDTGGL